MKINKREVIIKKASMIRDLPSHEKPREKLIEKGSANLKNAELLAILLRTGKKGKSAIEISKEIIRKNPLKKILRLQYDDLAKIKGIGPAKACQLLAAIELTKRALEVEDNNLPSINSSKDAVFHLQELRTAKREHLVALYLDARNQLIHKETISIGTLNANLIHPRELFKPAVDHLAAAVIIAHNHPSGDVEPSEDDIEVTERIEKAGKIMGVELIDHIIISEKDYCSIIRGKNN